jgi:hypothetical protein
MARSASRPVQPASTPADRLRHPALRDRRLGLEPQPARDAGAQQRALADAGRAVDQRQPRGHQVGGDDPLLGGPPEEERRGVVVVERGQADVRPLRRQAQRRL